MTFPRIGVAAGLLSAILIAGLLVGGCSRGVSTTSNGSGSASATTRTGERAPIAPAMLRGDVERQGEWSFIRKAACPRQLPDRHEELSRYPAISLMEGLGYLTISDGTARGMYVKNMQMTEAGRKALGSYLQENAEKYIITIAVREYLPGKEEFTILQGPERLVADFRWRWKALNVLGERLRLGSPYNNFSDFGGFATYTHASGGWTLDKVFLNSIERDYTHGV